MNQTPGQKPDKKPYRTPSLVLYGDLARITNAVGMSGNKDNGGGKTSKSLP